MYEILDKEKYEELQKEIRDANQGKSNRNIAEILEEMKKYIYFIPSTEEEKKDAEVENIIDRLALKYERVTGGSSVATFTEGYCYYFAVMLKRIFKEAAEIYILMNNGEHAIVKIDNNFYDVNGNIKKEFDRNGDFRNKIVLEDYYSPTEEEFLYFCSCCNAGRNRENIEKIEKICDEITEEMLKQLEDSKKIKI